MRIRLGYPSPEDEKQILKTYENDYVKGGLKPVLTGADVLALQEEAEKVKMDESLIDYLLKIVEATRKSDKLSLGVSPRGALFLRKAARAMALVMGRDYCIPDDVKSLAAPVLSHRVIVNTRGGAYGRRSQDTEDIIMDIVETIEVPV